MEAQGAQPSVGELLKTLVGETGMLMRQELTLARVEMTVKAKDAAISTSMILVGAGVSLVALIGACASAVVGLTEVMPLWAACLVVAVFLAVLAAMLVSTGLGRLRALDPLPQQTIASLKEVAQLPSGRAEVFAGFPREKISPSEDAQ